MDLADRHWWLEEKDDGTCCEKAKKTTGMLALLQSQVGCFAWRSGFSKQGKPGCETAGGATLLSVQNHSHSWRPKDRYQEQEYGYRALKRLHLRGTHSQSHSGSRRWPSDALANVSRATSTYGGGPDVTSQNSKSRRVSWWTRSRFLRVRVRLVHCSIGVGGTIDTLTPPCSTAHQPLSLGAVALCDPESVPDILWWQVTHPDPVWS